MSKESKENSHKQVVINEGFWLLSDENRWCQ
jgi:hypothetical protein